MKNSKSDDDTLRGEAEDRLRSGIDLPDDIPAEDAKRLIHELRVHQIELEMQNDELRRSQIQLDESRMRYADLYDFAPVGYLTLNQEGLIVEANLTVAKRLGKERSRILKRPFLLHVFGKDRDAFQLHLAKVVKTGEPQVCEVRLTPGIGEEFYARLDSIFIEDASGKCFARTTITDITDRKQAELGAQAKLAVEEEFHSFVKEVGDYAIFMLDATGHVINWNVGAEQIKGYLAKEIIGRNHSCFYTPEDNAREWLVQVLLRAAAEGRFEDEGWRVRKDGSRFWANVVFTAVHDKDGSLRGFSKITRDVTERNQAETALKESQVGLAVELAAIKRLYQIGTRFVSNGELGKVLEEVVDAAIAITGSDMGNIQLLDNSGELKIIAQRGFKQPFLDFFNSVHEGQAACGTALKQRQRVIIEDVAQSAVFTGSPAREAVLASGARAVQATPICSRSEHLLGMLSTHYKTPRRPDERDLLFIDMLSQQIGDMLERTRAEEELRKSRDELELRVLERTAELKSYMAKLEQSNQALQDFASIASHDMKEPLRKVISFGNMLRQKSGDSLGKSGNDYLSRMLHATERMQSLLTGLLDYSRVATASEPFKAVDLSHLIGEVLSDLEVRILKTGGEVHVGDLPVISADPTQMRQLFQNLIGNALKFHKPGEKATVHVSSLPNNDSGCQIVVEDSGIGFEEQHLDRIFAPFQRLHGRSSQYEGTGMGLAICKKIVERHGGQITARSAPGQGAAFTVTLPAKQQTKT